MPDLDRALRQHVQRHTPERVPDLARVRADAVRSRRRRTTLVAIAVSVLVVGAGVSYDQLLGGAPGSVPTAGPTAGPSAGPTGPVGSAAVTSCAFEYGPDTLAAQAFAFDGEVTALGESVSNRDDSGDLDLVGVTFRVHRWFAGGSGGTVTVDMDPPTRSWSGVSEWGPSYGVGTRLLVSGQPRWGGAPLEQPIAWACGFTRYHDEATAAEWAAAFGD